MVNIIAELSSKYPDIPDELLAEIIDSGDRQLIMDANQECEVNEIIREFDKKGIEAVMLKGWYLKQLYPRRDLRNMIDTDIFIKQSDELAVHKILTEHEYECNGLGNKKDNKYTKLPFVVLEIHMNLFIYEEIFNKHFSNPDSDMYVWKRLAPIEGYSNIYRMDDEMFFVYLIAHIVKHLSSGGGIGIRAFLDLWVYLNSKPDLDFDIIDRDFESIKIKKFADCAIALAQYWFDNKPASDEVIELGEHILQCGVYGKKSFFVANSEVMRDGKKHGRLGYAYKRAFPGMKSMKVRYPQLEKKPWLLPACYSKRLYYSLTHRKSAIKGEISNAGNMDYEQLKRIRELYKKIGLEEN